MGPWQVGCPVVWDELPLGHGSSGCLCMHAARTAMRPRLHFAGCRLPSHCRKPLPDVKAACHTGTHPSYPPPAHRYPVGQSKKVKDPP